MVDSASGVACRTEAGTAVPVNLASGLLDNANTHIFICGLKGMEASVDEALADICRKSGRDWAQLMPDMRACGRYHVETC